MFFNRNTGVGAIAFSNATGADWTPTDFYSLRSGPVVEGRDKSIFVNDLTNITHENNSLIVRVQGRVTSRPARADTGHGIDPRVAGRGRRSSSTGTLVEDLLCGSANSYLVTLVERQTRYLMLAKISNRDTQSVVTALIKQAKQLREQLYRSLTWDRGMDLADHRRFTLATDVAVYFCDP